MTLDAQNYWGEVEVPLPPGENAPLIDGLPQKYYFSLQQALRGFADPKNVRCATAPIPRRPAADRQVPPGYSGSGPVAVQLLTGYRNWRMDPAIGEIGRAH